MKKNLYINEGEIKRDGNVLKIRDKKIPISMIDNVFLFEKVKISISARNLLLKNKRNIVFFNKKYEFVGILLPEFLRSDFSNRLWQYENRDNLDCAKYIVSKKIKEIENYIDKNLDFMKLKLKQAKSLNEILGVEGQASRLMFDDFKKKLRKKGITEFEKRAYNPPPDKINGVLGFLYTLYYSYVFSEIIASGFDPYIGFLHQKRGKHAVFASDVMEEARVKLTFLCLEILDEVYPDMFEGRYLTLEGRKKVLKRFDEFLFEYDNLILKGFKERKC
ncbi:CRISPR-associated endonuclease Cas1 [Caminibacter pacificus]